MELDTAASLLAELGNPTRLRIVRLLVRAGDAGKPVGEIQRALAIPASTLSHHLSHLRQVGLVASRREGTVLRCRLAYRRFEGLVTYLTAECCADEHAFERLAAPG